MTARIRLNRLEMAAVFRIASAVALSFALLGAAAWAQQPIAGFDDEPTTERSVETTEESLDGEPPTDPQPFRDIVFSADGKLMATTTGLQLSRREYSVWDTATWTKRCSYYSKQSARTLYLSPDGKRMIVGVEKGPSQPVDPAAPAVAKGPEKAPPDKKAPPMGKIVYVDTTTGKPTRVDFAGAAKADKVFASPDGTLMAVTDAKDFSIGIWDIATNELKTTLKGHSAAVQAFAFSDDNKTAVSGAAKNGIIIWDMAKGEPKHKNYIWGTVVGVAFSKDGKRIAATSSGNLVRTFSTSSGRRLVKVGGPKKGPGIGNPERVAFSPDGKLLAYAGTGTAIGICRLDKAAPQSNPAEIAALIAQLDDDRFQIREMATAKLIKMGDVASDALAKAEKDNPTVEMLRRLKYVTSRIDSPGPDLMLVGHTQRIDGLKFTPDGKYLVSGSHDKTLRIWSVQTGKTAATLVSTGEPYDADAMGDSTAPDQGRGQFQSGATPLIELESFPAP